MYVYMGTAYIFCAWDMPMYTPMYMYMYRQPASGEAEQDVGSAIRRSHYYAAARMANGAAWSVRGHGAAMAARAASACSTFGWLWLRAEDMVDCVSRRAGLRGRFSLYSHQALLCHVAPMGHASAGQRARGRIPRPHHGVRAARRRRTGQSKIAVSLPDYC